jgi:hypothetical protein
LKDSLPSIKGTPKQIVWAERIRLKAMEGVREYCDEQKEKILSTTAPTQENIQIVNTAIDNAYERMRGMDSATWWIENRIFVKLEVTKWFRGEIQAKLPSFYANPFL